jgi:phage-related protein
MKKEVATAKPEKPLAWVGSALRDLRQFPDRLREIFGHALYVAQCGDKHSQAKPLQGFGGAGVLEVVERHDGGTCRAVYTVKFAGRVYVLHVFQKKSKRGIKTPKPDMELIKLRLKDAEQAHEEWLKEGKGK